MFIVKDYSNKDVVLKAGFVARYDLSTRTRSHVGQVMIVLIINRQTLVR